MSEQSVSTRLPFIVTHCATSPPHVESHNSNIHVFKMRCMALWVRSQKASVRTPCAFTSTSLEPVQ